MNRRRTGFASNPMILVAWLLFAGSLVAQTSGPAGSATVGRTLFWGTVRLENGGPPCSACHSVADLPFPKGGTMGPDLTRVYSKLGPTGLNSALETLFFPAMTSLYAYRPLTSDERRNLATFFQRVDGQKPGTPTPAMGGFSLAGFFILIAVTGIAGRRRVRSVRKALLERVRVRTGIHT